MNFRKIKKKFTQKIHKTTTRRRKNIKKQQHTAEYNSIIFFSVLFGVVILRLVWLQVFQSSTYDEKIAKLHYKESLLKAKRGDIYVYDKSKKAIPVTKNITLYDLYLEPQYFAYKNLKDNEATGAQKGEIANPSAIPKNKEKFIRLLTPYIYQHLCIQYGTQSVTPEQCVRNIEAFTNTNILPQKPEFFYTGSGVILDSSGAVANEAYNKYNRTWYEASYQEAIKSLTQEKAKELITKALEEKIIIGKKSANYLGFFTNKNLLEDLKKLSYVKVHWYYAYILPKKISNTSTAEKQLTKILETYHRKDLIKHMTKQLNTKESQYIEIAKNMHPDIAENIKNLKKKYSNIFRQCQKSKKSKRTEKIKTLSEDIKNKPHSPYNKKRQEEKTTLEKKTKECIDKADMLGDTMNVPFFHGLGTTSHENRYYPYNSFLSHTIGMVNSEGKALYGVEEYMDEKLKGKNGKVIGRASGAVGAIWANNFNVQKAVHGSDVYLTIDQNIQKYIEKILPWYHRRFQADSISVIVMEPKTGYVKAMANYPTYNPNKINSASRYIPLSPKQSKITDEENYIDVHLFTKNKNWSMDKATTEERADPTIPKRITENTYGSEVFVDKNIKYAYEPGSVFKPITVAIGTDIDEINLYDTYFDKGIADITDDKWNVLYTIKNVSSKCKGNKSYLNALIYSCNLGMMDIIKKIGKPIFYNYIEKLGFGSKTHIELGGEETGKYTPANIVSYSKFLNNSFGLGLTATPIQLAQWFATLLNGGILIKPTIIDKIYNPNTKEFTQNKPKVLRRVFKKETTKKIKEALFQVIEVNELNKKWISIEGFTLWGKTGTAEIVYKGKYKGGNGRTNASFIGTVTKENSKYIVVIQIRRPRWKRRWAQTAWPLFKDIAEFLIAYDLIQK